MNFHDSVVNKKLTHARNENQVFHLRGYVSKIRVIQRLYEMCQCMLSMLLVLSVSTKSVELEEG